MIKRWLFVFPAVTALILLVLLPTFSLAQAAAPAGAPTVAEARAFVAAAEKRLRELDLKAARAAWVQANFITDDTEAMAADAAKEQSAAVTELAKKSRRFERLKLPADLARKLKLLKLALSAPPPANAAERNELIELGVKFEGDYGKGKYCRKSGECLDINALSKIMAESRDPKELLEMWAGWHAYAHDIKPPMRERYARFVELSNKGAREMGFKDAGALWRSGYDMPPDQFAAEVERLWQQVRPLYLSLHTYVRSQLVKKYGKDVVPPDGPIPAHLLGNMWAQEWGNIYPLVAPPKEDPGYDLTELLKSKKVDARGMARYGERFFTSLGFEPLPQSFWERSLFTKPADRDVVCHASAWDVDGKNDVRLKMCIQIRDEDFVTVHHELGHNFYQRAYSHQPYLFLGSANDGFHEAVGDTIALSVTPEYLHEVGLLEKAPKEGGDLGFLMKQAMDKVAFLPFGLLIDQWRWRVFSGEIKPADYNRSWWEMRTRYQGVAAPMPRSEADFDPGAKYHVAANVPYTRYFLARILQFQFHRALCKEAGYTGPLHRCSIYNNKAAGAKLNKMLEMGASRPWPDALEAMTGERQMDATAMLDYFAPLKKWLDEQNAKNGAKPGWE
jgi:peptidyl-dipeptidase A